MWKDITRELRDPGLEGARRYLVNKVGIKPNRCAFYSDVFGMLPLPVAANRPFAIYILSHGCPGGKLMSSGKYVEGGQERIWGPIKLARELIARGLPQDRPGRIKLCLCHSAQNYNGFVFAQMLAQAICMISPNPERFSRISVGGFNYPVHWKEGARFNHDDRKESAARTYYHCVPQGNRVQDKFNELTSSKIPKYDSQNPDDDNGDRWAYFPFNYLPG